MYSPADRPSSTRAAPAKKRNWSTAGGSSSLGGELPAACRCCGTSASTSSAARASTASASLSSARCRSAGVVSRQRLERGGGGAPSPRPRPPAPETGRLGEDLAGGRVDQVGVAAVDRVDVLAVDEIAQNCCRS